MTEVTMAKKYKIIKSYDCRDIFRYAQKTGRISKKFDEKLFSAIIRDINIFYGDQLINGEIMKLPYNMGQYMIRKIRQRKIFDEKGNIQYYGPVNWQETKRIRETDEYARENKSLAFFDNELYKVKRLNPSAKYHNFQFYALYLHYKLFKRLSKMINNNFVEYI